MNLFGEIDIDLIWEVNAINLMEPLWGPPGGKSHQTLFLSC